MRKTRVLAALLCLMMIATAIPMMQASATETDAGLTAVLAGATEKYTVDFAEHNSTSNVDYVDTAGKHLGAGESTTWATAELARLSDAEGGTVNELDSIRQGNKSLYCRDEMILEDSSLSSKNDDGNNRLERVEVTADGLAVRAGNLASADSKNEDKIPGATGENAGWTWNDTATGTKAANYKLISGKLDVNMGYAGAMLFKLKLDKDGSSAKVEVQEGANGQTQIGFVVSSAGIQMIGAGSYAYGDAKISTTANSGDGTVSGPQFETGAVYEVLLKNDFNRYTLYVRKEGDANFTKVVTGTAKNGDKAANTIKVLKINALYNTQGSQATKLVTKDSVTKQYLAEYVASQGWVANETEGITEITDGNVTRPLSQVTFKSITTYEDSANSGMTLQEALGQNAVAIAKYEANEENAALIKGGMTIANWGLSGGGTNNGDVIVDSTNKNLTLPLSALSVDTAIEFGVKIPENPADGVNMRGNTTIEGKPFDIKIGGSDDNNANARGTIIMWADSTPMVLKNKRNIDTDARTFLLTMENEGGTDYMKLWAKHPVSGKYLYLGKNGTYTKNINCAPRFENTKTIPYTITSMAVYNKNGLANTDALPVGAADMYQYVDADMSTATVNFERDCSGGEDVKGDLVYNDNEAGVLKITLPTGSTSLYSNVKTANAFIPKGGYAEIRFKGYPKGDSSGNGSFSFITRDGEKFFNIKLQPNKITATNADAVTGSVYNMDPNTWMDMRIVRSADDKFSVYLKKDGENAWTRVVTNAEPIANALAPLMQIGGYGNANTNRDTDAHYVDYLNVYGPAPTADQKMLVLDGKVNEQVTKVLTGVEGATVGRGVQAVIAPGVAGTAIFAGYEGNKLVNAIPVTFTAEDDRVIAPTTQPGGTTVKVFLWSDFDNMTSLAPMQSFAK